MNFLKEYTILAELGQGGFAKVYKVRHDALGYIRAIRVLNEPVTDENSKTYQKFLRECKVLLRLGNGSHRNIVHIYQPRLLDNHALVEMDFVDGQDLSNYLRANGNYLPADEVLQMVEQMSSALAYCHEDIYKFCMDREADNLQDDPMDGSRVLMDETTRHRLIEKYKVIHNDIHSGNIMRREDGSFVLLDFGLAITSGDDVRKSSRHENGAVEYKAPEKWNNEASLTEQCDVYSFGVVMYEYLAGRVPFPYDKTVSKAEAEFRVYKAHLQQTPLPIFNLRKACFEAKHPNQIYEKDYPDWLETAIMRCLEKDPAKRFLNGKELHEFVLRHLAEDAEKASAAALAPLTEENRELKEGKKNVEFQLAQLTERNSGLALQLKNLESQLEEMVKRNNHQSEKEAEIASELSQLKTKLASKDHEIAKLKTVVSRMELSAKDHVDATALRQQLDQLTAKNKTLTDELTQSEKRTFDLEAQVNTLKAQVNTLKKKLSGKRKPWLSVFAALLGLLIGACVVWMLMNSDKKQKLPSDDIALHQEIDSLQHLIDDLENQLQENYEASILKQGEVDSLQKKVSDLEEQIVLGESDALKAKQKIIDELNKEIVDLKSKQKSTQPEVPNNNNGNDYEKVKNERDDYMEKYEKYHQMYLDCVGS